MRKSLLSRSTFRAGTPRRGSRSASAGSRSAWHWLVGALAAPSRRSLRRNGRRRVICGRASRNVGSCSRQALASVRHRAARMEDAARRTAGEVRHAARDRIELRAVAIEARQAGDQARQCRDGAAPRRCAPTGAVSIIRPPYITATRSADSATRPRSWVISTIAAPVAARTGQAPPSPAPGSSRRAPSSARRRSAAPDRWPSRWRSSTRWRMPPENSLRKLPVAALADRECRRDRAVRSTRARDLRARHRSDCAALTASPICVPIRKTGLSEVIGSWKIIDIDLPRTLAHLPRSRDAVRSAPRRHDLPDVDPHRRGQQTHHGEHRQALARAGFADDAEHLVRRHVERDAVDQPRHAASAGHLDRRDRAPRARSVPTASPNGSGSTSLASARLARLRPTLVLGGEATATGTARRRPA